MHKFQTSFIAFASLATVLSVKTASAAVNDFGCKPSAAKPFPVVLVHGQSGNFEGMDGISNTLEGEGYCVFGKNHGWVPDGFNGQDHLSVSADQIGEFVDEVLAKTGASKVNLIGHSAGTGVIDNFILAKGGWAKTNRVVSFGGLHHPYTHIGSGEKETSVYLPNLLVLGRRIIPNITIKALVDVVKGMGMIDQFAYSTAASNFVEDLFNSEYWSTLYNGKVEERPGAVVLMGISVRTFETPDSAPSVCYTNIVVSGDMMVGQATGFLDKGENIENALIDFTSGNAHAEMIGEPKSLAKMVEGINKPCKPAPPRSNTLLGTVAKGDGVVDTEAANAIEDALRKRAGGGREALDYESAGCSAAGVPASTSSTSLFGAFAAVTAIAGAARRSIRRARERLSSKS